MRFFLALLLILPLSAHASFLIQYGLNYSSQKDDSKTGKFEESRTFHKALIAASVNGRKTLFFGWNINSWSSTIKQGNGDEDTYSMLEMGPRLQWFVNDNYNLYFSAEWNPYAKGSRDKASDSHDINGQSYGLGFGYRFRLSRLIGFGASLHYHALTVKEEKTGSSFENTSDSVTNLMPMLELTILTK
jgi:hypothetical protein